MEDKVGKNVKNIREGRELRRVEGLGNNLEHTEGTVESGDMNLKKIMLGKGCEGGEGTRDEADMRENEDGRRVLGNVDQNCESFQLAVMDGLKKVGSWKRKDGAKGNKGRGDLGEEKKIRKPRIVTKEKEDSV